MSGKRQEKTISLFDVVLNWLVCLQPDWIPHGMSPQTHPWVPKSHWNISVYPKTIPQIPNSFTKRHQAQTDANKHWQQEILFSTYDWVNLVLNHHFGKTLKKSCLSMKGKIFSPDIKISKPFPKMVRFCNFLWIWHLSQRNYNWQSFWITL